jgi:hypothetical protein
MDKKTIIILGAGILLSILLAFISIYLAGIALILTIVVGMSLMIMQDTLFLPNIVVTLKDDARGIILTNAGNSPAVKIHVSLVPMNREYDLPALGVDESHEYPLESMIQEVKVVVRFENENSQPFSHSVKLSAYGNEFEPLKPVIPLFKWK